MLKTMKYEVIKNRVPIYVILATLAICEIAFVYCNYFNFEYVVIPVFALFITGIIANAWILINGIGMFNRDFKNKSGFLVYMTPLPASKIITAKMLVSYLTALIFSIAYYLLGVLDVKMLLNAEERVMNDEAVESVLSILNVLIGADTFKSIGVLLVVFAVAVFEFLSIAYVAISLANTLLRGKKLSGLLCFVIFLLISVILTRFENLVLPEMDTAILMSENGFTFGTTDFSTLSFWAHVVYEAVVGVIGVVTSSYLIEKKIDL